nr:reverse transcriptase domain-containing protein [Tanacetum cinerariifolium]
MIQDLETKFGRTSDHQSSRPTGTLPSNTQTNLKPSTSNKKPYQPPPAQNEHVNAVSTRSGKTYDPPVNLTAKPAIFLDDSDDEVDETEKEAEPLRKKPTHADTPPLKAYKPKFMYPQRLYKEKMKARYTKFLDMIKEVRINVPLVDVLAGMPNYGKFLKDIVSNKTNHTYQYPIGVVENMLVQVRKFMFPVDFVILQMEEDDRVLLILGRPFLHTADAIIRVKNQELNLGIREDRATFLIDKAMQYSHLNDDICFCMNVINEVTEDELDALLDDFKPFLSISKKISETPLDKEFEEFMT